MSDLKCPSLGALYYFGFRLFRTSSIHTEKSIFFLWRHLKVGIDLLCIPCIWSPPTPYRGNYPSHQQIGRVYSAKQYRYSKQLSVWTGYWSSYSHAILEHHEVLIPIFLCHFLQMASSTWASPNMPLLHYSTFYSSRWRNCHPKWLFRLFFNLKKCPLL